MAMEEHDTRRRRGRPREFDPHVVLDDLLQLFWEKGYEATSLLDMVAATGCNKSSLRAAFGNKKAIYAAVLERYSVRVAESIAVQLENGEGGLVDIVALFDAQKAAALGDAPGMGCMATNTATELGSQEPISTEFHTKYRDRLRSAFGAALARAAERGEIDGGSVEERASLLATLFFGMAITSRAGAQEGELEQGYLSIHHLLLSWRLVAS